jgi:hypothetical protein
VNLFFSAVLLFASLSGAPARMVSNVANSFPHNATGGFSTPTGDGFDVTYADGTVSPQFGAHSYGDATTLALHAPIIGGTSIPDGTGYWLVALDGGMFTYGHAHFYGSTGSLRLNQPVFSMASTASGHGYWLVARDGGIFTFGDAKFHGSAGGIPLQQPIVGMTTTSTGNGYRLVAADGGIFDYGDAKYYGGLPGLGLAVNDVVGMAPTPTSKGYWIVRKGGQPYAFGDAQKFGSYKPTTCDSVIAIFSNPSAPGYRLVTTGGATIPFGNAPGGTHMTGRQRTCVAQTYCGSGFTSAAAYQAAFNVRGPLWDGADGAEVVDLGDGRRLWLWGDTYSGPTTSTSIIVQAFLRNSISVQQGNCMEFRLGGVINGVNDFVPRPGPTEWYWPDAGIADPAHNVVYLAAMHAIIADGGDGFHWRIVRNEILTLDYHSLQLIRATPMPTAGGLLWGTAMMQSGGYDYIYANQPGAKQYVARALPQHLLDGQWEFWTGSTWSPNGADVRPMTFMYFSGNPDVGSYSGITVLPYGSGYIASAKRCDLICTDLTAWYSPTPAGPWRAVNSNSGKIATTGAAAGLVVYGGHMVPAATPSGFIGVWSVNRQHGDSNALYVYGGRTGELTNLPSPSTLATDFPS